MISAPTRSAVAGVIARVVASLQTGAFALSFLLREAQHNQSNDLPVQRNRNVGDWNVGAPTLHCGVLA
jgi:hypothetical protein